MKIWLHIEKILKPLKDEKGLDIDIADITINLSSTERYKLILEM
jgi:hypothetical protein